ncbi:magnesium-translocating P-type ATPase [Cupriavidus basilensis OR16]|uniref:Magnesium-transporting ATPase, P-type 1 n=1 Tax=Cupriavidus basilensis OR16 TaxID=1127483 RepID=H1SDC6_9BURK|nr:magnesium-translocating P-type ATPase [Cupriavidus basilensis]EHP39495.1 magnesium-translocating P-type ATPase [Cupriavidus basilensis OR16]
MPEAILRAASTPLAVLLGQLNASPEGLTDAEATRRLQGYGPNLVDHERQRPALFDLLRRLLNPLNVLLLTLATVSAAIHDYDAATVILVMVMLSVGLATVQERRSGRAAAALRAMVHTTTATQRRPEPGALPLISELPIGALVPGDIVHLSAGDLVPADARLLASKDLFVNQSALTGESLPVEKFALESASGDEPGTLENIVLMGTAVISGSATVVVVLTGPRAMFGSIARSLEEETSGTVFEQGLQRFARLMIGLIVILAPLVFVINGLTKGDWLEALLFAVAVAVGLTPEMLPMLVTVNLAKGALAMSRRKVIVKRLSAIQNLGAMDVLCTDKTGTLTQDRIILKKHVDLAGQETVRVLEFAYLNSYHQSGLHNLLDKAVLLHDEVGETLRQEGGYRKIDEVPFDFERRRMSVVVDGPQGRLLVCKGAVEEVYAACASAELGGQTLALDDSHRHSLMTVCNALNEDGFRVIAIAYKPLPPAPDTHPYSVADESALILLGYIAFIDPPKDSAAPALAALRDSGIEVKVLTGDSPVIARKICREVGLDVDRAVLGAELDGLSPQALGELAERTQLFAKLAPAHKAAIVKALRARGRVVGVLGDGINDGPALKAADVGISVDSGADIAKESASIILLEKSLLVLHDGVIEGRKVFANLLKYLRMGASSNFGNMFSVLGASAWLPFLPMAPIQVLTNNLLYDFSQTALPTDNVDDDAVSRPRRWEIGKLGRYILCIGPISSLFDYITFATLYWGLGASTPAQQHLFQTGWFLESLLSQTLIVHVIRTRNIPFVQSRGSTALIATTLAICLIGIWLPYSPLAAPLGLVSAPGTFWLFLPPIILGYCCLTYALRGWLIRRLSID